MSVHNKILIYLCTQQGAFYLLIMPYQNFWWLVTLKTTQANQNFLDIFYYNRVMNFFNINMNQMNEGSGTKYNSKISIQSLRSRNSGSMSLGRHSTSQRNPSLSKKASLVYVMSIDSDRMSDGISNMLDQNSYVHNLPWIRNSVGEAHKNNNMEYQRRRSNQGRNLCHACDCFPTCRGQQCPCFMARTQMCLKDSCCETCIQMKNSLLMADRGEYCNCKNTQCLKSYCKCFHNNGVCTSLCKCEDCKNKIDSKQRAEAMESLKNVSGNQEAQRKYCTCKKTKCNKKYCSCFANGIKCSKQCQCENCINCDQIADRMSEQRPPSFYNEQQLASMQMPDRMSFEKVEFNRFNG